MFIPLSMDAFRRGDFEEALSEAERIVDSGDERGVVLALAAAIAGRNAELTEKYLARFSEIDHLDPADPMREVRNILNSPEVLEKYSTVLTSVVLS